MSAHFKSANIREYDDSTDPDEHLARFENMVMLHCYRDEIKCKTFLTTLVDLSQRWFDRLEPRSIRSFEDFKNIFLYHFSSIKRYQKTVFSLFEVKQARDESLRAYIRKFNRAALEVPSCAPETKTTAFTQGLQEGYFFRSLVKRLPRDFEDLLSRAEKYINMEEAQKQKREIARRERGDKEGRMEERVPREKSLGRFSRYTPLKGSRDRAVHLFHEKKTSTPAYLPPPDQGIMTKYCSFHKGCHHDTSECRQLKRKYSQTKAGEVEPTHKQVRRPPWVPRSSGQAFSARAPSSRPVADYRDRPSTSERGWEVQDRRKSPTLGVIKMISGGSTDGDSNRARKNWSKKEILRVGSSREEEEPTISFGPQDLHNISLPHNDVLVIHAKIANYDIRQVFIDSGSSVDVLFQEALDQMDLKDHRLGPVETALFGFVGHTVHLRGEIMLPLTMGSEELRKSVMTLFTVVDAQFSYNIILGRPAMNAFKAVASTYHQQIKFPVKGNIGEVQGDQPSSRKCYAETVRVEKKRAKRDDDNRMPRGEVNVVKEVQDIMKEEQEEVTLIPG